MVESANRNCVLPRNKDYTHFVCDNRAELHQGLLSCSLEDRLILQGDGSVVKNLKVLTFLTDLTTSRIFPAASAFWHGNSAICSEEGTLY